MLDDGFAPLLIFLMIIAVMFLIVFGLSGEYKIITGIASFFTIIGIITLFYEYDQLEKKYFALKRAK